MKRLMTPRVTKVLITPAIEDDAWKSLMASTFVAVMSLLIVCSTFLLIRRQRLRRHMQHMMATARTR